MHMNAHMHTCKHTVGCACTCTCTCTHGHSPLTAKGVRILHMRDGRQTPTDLPASAAAAAAPAAAGTTIVACMHTQPRNESFKQFQRTSRHNQLSTCPWASKATRTPCACVCMPLHVRACVCACACMWSGPAPACALSGWTMDDLCSFFQATGQRAHVG